MQALFQISECPFTAAFNILISRIELLAKVLNCEVIVTARVVRDMIDVREILKFENGLKKR